MIISGERDQENEVTNDEGNNKWTQAGVYDEETGLFFIREREHISIQNHFKILRSNRMAQKKPINNYAYKTANEKPTFKPKLHSKTDQYANNRRAKLFAD